MADHILCTEEMLKNMSKKYWSTRPWYEYVWHLIVCQWDYLYFKYIVK